MITALKSFVLAFAMIVIGLMMFTTFIRTIIGPRIGDRLLAINMIGTQVILLICLLAVYLNETGLVDMALIYAMFSFLSIVLFCRIYLGIYNERLMKQRSEDEEL